MTGLKLEYRYKRLTNEDYLTRKNFSLQGVPISLVKPSVLRLKPPNLHFASWLGEGTSPFCNTSVEISL